MAVEKSDQQIEQKFRGLTDDYLGATQVTVIFERLWRLDEMDNVAAIPGYFVIA